jgi:molybdopterin converting factor small subunit
MMKIKVYPGPLCATDALDEDGFIFIEDGTTVGELLRKIKCPRLIAAAGLFAVNHEQVRRNMKLSDGDTVSIIAPLAGG